MNERLKKDIADAMREYIFEDFVRVQDRLNVDLQQILRNHNISEAKVDVSSSSECDLVVHISMRGRKYRFSIEPCPADFSEV